MTDHPVVDLATAAAHSSPDILSMLIPIIAIVMGIGMGMLALWLDYRKKREIYQLHHVERMAAIEKGIEVPQLPPEFFQSNRRFNPTPPQRLYRGLLYTFLGAALVLARYVAGDYHVPSAESGQVLTGLMLIAAGIANLLFYGLDALRKVSPATNTDANSNDGL